MYWCADENNVKCRCNNFDVSINIMVRMMRKKLTPAIYLLVKLNFIYLLSIGMMMTAAPYAGIESETAGLAIYMAVLAVVLAVTVNVIAKPAFAALLLAVGFALFIFFFREDLAAGAQIFSGRLYDEAIGYFEHINVPKIEPAENELKSAALFVALLTAVWEAWLVLLNLKKCRILCAIVPVIAVIAAVLTIGDVPPMMAVICFFAGILGLTALGSMSVKTAAVRLKTTAAAMAVFLAALCLSSAFMPQDGWIKAEDRHQIQKTVREKYAKAEEWLTTVGINPFKNKFGISKGRLDRAGNLEYDGKTVMTVGVSRVPSALLYLKAYGAGRFENNRWKEIDNREIEKISGGFGLDSEQYLREVWNSERNAAASDSQHEMVIKPEKGADEVIYVPYTANLADGDKLSVDGYVTELFGGQERKITYLDSFYASMKSLEAYGAYSSGGEVMMSYNDFVRENYLSVEGMSARFRTEFKLPDSQNSAALTAEFIRESFKSREISYTLEPGNMPSGENAVDYFLYENKKGYCMHFASAAVMIFRLNGIPARYAEGYIISPGSFLGNGRKNAASSESGYVTQVRDYQAHAWPEVYIDGFGWVPVEVTPAYEDESLIMDNTSSLENEETESTETAGEDGQTDSTGGSEEESRQSESGGDGSDENDENGISSKDGHGDGSAGAAENHIFEQSFFRTIFIVSMLAISIAAVLYMYVRIASKRHLIAIEEAVLPKSAEKLAVFTYRWLAIAGIKSAERREMRSLVSEAGEKIPEVSEQMFIFLMDKLLKAAYSKNGLTKEEYAQTKAAFYEIVPIIYKHLQWPLKLTARYILCLPYKK